MKLIREFGQTSPRFSIVPPGFTSDAWGQNKKRVCHKPHPIRPERAEAPSPGHRPERAKAFNIKAFALSIIFALGKIKR